MTSKTPQQPYHLYHAYPHPLDEEQVTDQTWLVNNGLIYSLVASLDARTVEEAFRAIQAGRGNRFVSMRTSSMLRETAPGDVLVGKEAAWMVDCQRYLRKISYALSRPLHASSLDDGPVYDLSWSPDSLHVAVMNSNKVSLHSPLREEERAFFPTYRRHESTGYALAWSPDGRHIASGGYHGDVHVWTPNPGGGYNHAAVGSILICRTEEATYRSEQITALAWAPDSKSLLAGDHEGVVVQWDTSTGLCMSRTKRHEQQVTAIAYSSKIPPQMVTASLDGTLHLWQEDAAFDLICRQEAPVTTCAWSPDGSLLVSSGDQVAPLLQFWDAATGEPLERLVLSTSLLRSVTILSVAWSPDGKYIAAGSDDGTIQVVDVLHRQHVQTFRSTFRRITALAWSPDGAYLAAGLSNGWSSRGQLQVWQAAEIGETAVSAGLLVPASSP